MKSFNFTFGLRGLFTPPSLSSSTSKVHKDHTQGTELINTLLVAVSEGHFEQARALLTSDFKAHEPALNKVLKADQLLYEWEVNRLLTAYQFFEIKKTATFSVFGDIDRDKYTYIKADYHTLENCTQLHKTISFELIARIDDDRIAHLLYCFGSNKAFDKLSSVQHARSLAHPC